MPVKVYRYRKPELSLTPTPGGSLSPNTTYYITGFYTKNWTYNGVHSPFADVATFSTDSTNLSVSVYWKTTIDIEGFEDAGSGKIRVKSNSHCLVKDNTIFIESGTYSGTYSVNTWEDYNNFLIVGSYSSDYTSTFRVDSIHNTMGGIVLYTSISNPFSGNDWVGDISKFNNHIWYPFNTNNIPITAVGNSPLYGTHQQVETSVSPPPPWSAVLTKGKTWIQCSGAATPAEIKQALIDADVTDVSYLQGDTLFVYGILQSTGTLSFSDMTIIVHSGMFGAYDNPTRMTLTRCSLHLLEVPYGSYMLMTANNSNFFYKVKTRYLHAGMTQVYKYAVGNSNSFISPGGIACEGMAYPVSNMKAQMDQSLTPYWRIDCSSKTMKFTNIEIQGGVLYLYYINSTSYLNDRLIDGIIINNSLNYDISVQYNNSRAVFDITNCDTTRTNNRKIVYTPYLFQSYTHVTDIYFWRKKTLKVLSEDGSVISEASVVLRGNDNIDYSYTTDLNGEVLYEVLEQKSLKAPTGYYFTNVYIDDYSLIVRKDGYETYTSKSSFAYLLETNITLKKSVDIMFSPSGYHIKADPTNSIDRDILLC